MRSAPSASIGFALALTLTGCAGPTARETLDAYAKAVKANDPAAARRLCDQKTRQAYDEQAFAAEWSEDPSLVRAIQEDRVAETAVFTLASGRKVVLVREDGRWRIAGAICTESVTMDTPVSALFAFFRGVQTEDWSLVRRVIPEALQGRFSSDAALKAHIETMRPRIAAAMEALGTDPAAVHPELDGETASITYAPHKTVKLRKEAGSWRILDLE